MEEQKVLRVLHTSDWHIGKILYNKKRYEEFELFLTWLLNTITEQSIDVLIIAGDIFDTTTPSSKAQEIYYNFLAKIKITNCKHIIIIAGNHDSPSLLDAPKTLLSSFQIHIIGTATETPEQEVFLLRNDKEEPELIVCAVPYLRERDLRISEYGESDDEISKKLLLGLKNHYDNVAKVAQELANKIYLEYKISIPIVATGHLFTSGGKTSDGDGVRELYVGTLAHIQKKLFPSCFDYLALGHLHVPQKVDNSDTVQYSGSPIPMGFGEARQQKIVIKIEFCKTKSNAQTIEAIPIPCFRKLFSIKGNKEKIKKELSEIKQLKLNKTDLKPWIEIIYNGDEIIPDLPYFVDSVLSDQGLLFTDNTEEKPYEVLRIKNEKRIDTIMKQNTISENLEDLDLYEVFERCLLSHNIPKEQYQELKECYNVVINSLSDIDKANKDNFDTDSKKELIP